MHDRVALRTPLLILFFAFASACAPAGPSSDAGDASALDQVPPTDAVADRAPAADAAPDVGSTCTDCGPNGHSHGDHCHCDPGYVERNGCCVAAPRCTMPDDMLEENDTVMMATNTTPSYSQRRLRVCPADEDVFRVPLMAGQRVEVNVTFSHASGDIDAYLFAPGVTDLGHTRPVGGSDGTADNEAFSYTATAAGDHHLLILGHNGAENAYDLQLTVSGP